MDDLQSYPLLRHDLIVSEQESDGQKYFVLKDPITFRYFRLREPEYYLVRQFDGNSDYAAVAQRVRDKFNLNISGEAVEKFAARIDELFFFEGRRAEYELSSGKYLRQTRKSLLSRLLFLKLKAFNPDRMLDKLLPPARLLLSPAAIVVMIIFILAGFAVYSANYEYFRFSPGELFNISSLVIIFVSLAIIIFIHEFAHALTCKYYGGQVREMGFLLLYFQICFYSNLSDSWMFRNKSHRLAVIWAGVFLQMVTFAVAVFGWRVTVVGTGVNEFFWLTANVCFVTLLFNLNPLIKLDGYYLLSEIVNIPNLRAKSFDYLKARLAKILGIPSAEMKTSRRERRIFFWYTFFAGLYSLFLIIYMAYIVYGFLVDNLAGFGFILFLLLLALIFKGPLYRAGKFFADREVMKALFSKPKNAIIGAIIAVIIIVVLFIIPFPRQVGGDVVVRPAAEYTITLISNQGLLELNLRRGGEERDFHTEHIQISSGDLTVLRLAPIVREGDKIKIGDTLAAIISNQVSTSLDGAKAELERLENELALAKSPPKPEEIESAQATVNTAAALVDQLTKDVERNNSLFEKKLISSQEKEQGEAALKMSKSNLEEAEAKLRLLKSPPKREEVAMLESQIQRQKANISYLTSQEAAQVITAPIAGEVVALYRNDLLIKVASMDKIEAEIPVIDNYLEYVHPEASVDLKVRSYPAQLFEGHVVHISGSAAGGKFEDKRARFPVYAILDNGDGLLRDGMSGYAKIKCGTASLFTILYERLKSFIRVEFWSWW